MFSSPTRHDLFAEWFVLCLAMCGVRRHAQAASVLSLLCGTVLVGCASFCYLGVGQRYYLVSPISPHVVSFTEEMAKRIRPGMTEAEVRAILGNPAGNYSTEPVYPLAFPEFREWVWSYPRGWLWEDGTMEKAWISNVGEVTVEFGSNGLVRRSSWTYLWTMSDKMKSKLLRGQR